MRRRWQANWVFRRLALRLISSGSLLSDSAAEMQGGVLVADPGATFRRQLLESLKAGAGYGIACEFRDSAGAPNHSRLGMIAVMWVE